jgi:hypothetical protein
MMIVAEYTSQAKKHNSTSLATTEYVDTSGIRARRILAPSIFTISGERSTSRKQTKNSMWKETISTTYSKDASELTARNTLKKRLPIDTD